MVTIQQGGMGPRKRTYWARQHSTYWVRLRASHILLSPFAPPRIGALCLPSQVSLTCSNLHASPLRYSQKNLISRIQGAMWRIASQFALHPSTLALCVTKREFIPPPGQGVEWIHFQRFEQFDQSPPFSNSLFRRVGNPRQPLHCAEPQGPS